jgi:hypothetical protein
MTFLLVPHTVTATTATIWIGAIEENVRTRSVSLEYSGDSSSGVIALEPSGWHRWKSYDPLDPPSLNPRSWLLPSDEPEIKTLHYQRLTIGLERERELTPSTSYSLNLHIDKQKADPKDLLRTARVTTLPKTLPSEENPFTLLLGSCFYGPEDPDGLVGKTYHHVPADQKPDVKVLCGDQVYLDNPWEETTAKWKESYSKAGLFRATLFEKYLKNWCQVVGKDAGFRQLLKDGANYFCSDDHEFWNNAPNFGVVAARYTIRRTQRAWWFREAAALFRALQSPSPLVRFEVPPLSFCIADTRINRDVKGTQFVDEEDLELVKEWIEDLQGPGVLVVGQPVLAKTNSVRSFRDEGVLRGAKSFLENGLLSNLKGLPGDIVSFYFDKDLPDYRDQYRELIDCIKRSEHSIVVLTGDVHYGRISHGELNPGSDNKFVEVVASPMKLVLGPKWKWSKLWYENVGEFGTYTTPPTDVIPNLVAREVAHKQNHFVTIEFSADKGAKVNMKVKAWPILDPKDWPVSPEGKASPKSEEVCRIAL